MMELTMSKSRYLSEINSQPVSASKYDKLTIGAAITRHRIKNTPEILLLQRKLDEEYYPGVYEIPGGKVEESDATICDAIIREVAEETNLQVREIVGELPQMTYTTEKKVKGEDGKEKTVKKLAIQLSYRVDVHDSSLFRWNPDEHCNGVWAASEDLAGLEITDGMRNIVEAALRFDEQSKTL